MLKYKRLMYLEFPNCNLESILIVPILFFMLFYNATHFSGEKTNNDYGSKFLQNSFAIESTDDKDKVKIQDQTKNKVSKETGDEESANNKNKKSIFNFVAVGDWDCTGETEDTVENIALLHNSFKQTIFILFYLSDSYALKQVVQRCF